MPKSVSVLNRRIQKIKEVDRVEARSMVEAGTHVWCDSGKSIMPPHRERKERATSNKFRGISASPGKRVMDAYVEAKKLGLPSPAIAVIDGAKDEDVLVKTDGVMRAVTLPAVRGWGQSA